MKQLGLHRPCQHVSHRLRCLPLGYAGHVGAGVQGEPGAEMPRHPGRGFDIHTVLQGQGGKGMTEVMKAKIGRPCLFQQDLHPFIGSTRMGRLLQFPGMGEDPFR